jgi:hypothetical protein
VIYDNGEQWWNDINGGKLLILPPKLSTGSHLAAKHDEVAKEITDFALEIISFIL